MSNNTAPDTAATSVVADVDTPVFNTKHIAYVFNERGFRVNEFATRLDMSPNIVEALLRGTLEPGELRIATLANMAKMLGIPLHTMFARPNPAPDPNTTAEPSPGQDPDGDAHADADQLIACVYDIGRTTATLISELAKAFGWTLDRTYTATKEANRRLQPAGLQLNTSHGELLVTPIRNHLDAQHALTTRKVYERGLHLNHYKAIHQILTNQPVTVNSNKVQRLRTLGGLVNLGVLTDTLTLTPTDAMNEAFIAPGESA